MLQSLSGVSREVRNVVDSDFTESELLRVIQSLPALDPKLGSRKARKRKP
jgi:hypothetical protein